MLHGALERISTELGDAPGARVAPAIGRALAVLGRATHADAVALWTCGAGASAERFAAWSDGAPRRARRAPRLPLDSLDWARAQLASGALVRVRVGGGLPENAAAERAFLCEQRIVAWALVPLLECGRLVGALELVSHSVGTGFEDEDASLLAIAARLFQSALRRERDELRARDAERMAALGRATAGVAHDVNNVLTAIRCYCDLLEKQVADDARADVAEVRVAAEHAAAIVDQLVRFARRPVGAAGASRASTRPAEALASLERLLASVAGERVAVAVDTHDGGARIALAPPAFDQLLVNLVSNARHAMPDGGRLAISTRACALDARTARRLALAPGDYVVLEVADTGAGMDATTRERLFEPWFTTRAGAGGSGIGLVTVAAIVEEAQGAIEVESAPGCGALFRIWLPTPRVARSARARSVSNAAPL
ncbi:MAG: ATP-binding protein [Myxococcota bacterium]